MTLKSTSLFIFTFLSIVSFKFHHAFAAVDAAGTNVSNAGTIYMITNDNQRRPYNSAGAFISYGFNIWKDVVPASSEDIALPIGSPIPPMNGSLINDNGTIYIITVGKREGFASANVFVGLGYTFSQAQKGDTSFMDSLAPINSITIAHASGSLVNRGGTIYLVTNSGRIAIASTDIFHSWWYNFLTVVQANSYDNALPLSTALMSRHLAGQLDPTDGVTASPISNPTTDITPPVISITPITNSGALSGIVAINAIASDNIGVSNVQFKMGSKLIGSSEKSPPYSINLNTANYSNGNYIITAIATDRSGNSTSATLPITINNSVFKATTTLSVETGNNTSACSASGYGYKTSGYCNGAMVGFSDDQSGIETPMQNVAPGNVSMLPVSDLFKSNTIQSIAEVQAWFCQSTSAPIGGYNGTQICGGHKSVGYSSTDPKYVDGEIQNMIDRGFSYSIIDWYNPVIDQNDLGAEVFRNQAATRCSGPQKCPMMMAVMEDWGGTPRQDCPTDGTDQTSCLITALETDITYMNLNYFGSNDYWKINGQPVLPVFMYEAAWNANWTTVWDTVAAYDASLSPYNGAPYMIFLDGNIDSHPDSSGSFAWIQPLSCCSVANQNNIGSAYLNQSYSYSNGTTIGSSYKGFDDIDAAWQSTPNRVMSQQCGQTLIDSAASAPSNMQYMQFATWNDYEEGTEIETGIDNCYSVSANINGSTLNWSLAKSNPQANIDTVHHFTVYLADANGNMEILKDNIPAQTSSLDLSTLGVPTGSWSVYVKEVSQPLILNKMSNGVVYTT
jgi:hypothetical protein